jgi:hypothetical protein
MYFHIFLGTLYFGSRQKYKSLILASTLDSVLVQEVLGVLHYTAYVAGVARAQAMLALEVDLHIVNLVGDMLAQLAAEPAIPSSVGIVRHDIWQHSGSVRERLLLEFGARQLVLVQGLLGRANRLKADVARVAAQLVLALQVAPHVVCFVGDVLAQPADEFRIVSSGGIRPDQV